MKPITNSHKDLPMKCLNILRLLPLIAVFIACLAARAPRAGEFPDDYFYFAAKRPQALRDMEGKAPPALTLKDWIGDKQELDKLKGKVVVVDFWATWCPPCRAALPHNVEMFSKHKDDGLMIIGVHDANRGADKMAAMAKDKKINYPLSVDDGGKSTKAWNISFWPTYFVIDRKGIVRAAGLDPESVDKVVAKLLKEDAAPARPQQ